MKKHKRFSLEKRGKLASLMLMPSLVFMGIIMIYPLFNSVWLALRNHRLDRPQQMGFDPSYNITRFLEDEVFFSSIFRTMYFTFVSVAVCAALGMLIAVCIDQLPKRLTGVRGVLLMPWIIPGVVVGYLFRYMFDTNVGIINHFLFSLGLIDDYLPWLMQANLAMFAVIVANIWNQLPFYVLMFTAGLKSIPDSIKEASYIEGASRWQEFLHITLPSIKGVFIITTLLQIIRNFNNFPIIFTMTGGGPVHATRTAVLEIYRQAFARFDFGYAALLGLVWVLILLAMTLVYVRLADKDF